jgi:ubiquitin-protein ligase
MDISFNTIEAKPRNDINDIIKSELNKFKLAVDQSIRYLTNFDNYSDDSLFMCYVDNVELEMTYDKNKLVQIDCYSNPEISSDLNNLIILDKSISDNLIIINNYFYENDPDNQEEEDEDDEDAHETVKEVIKKEDLLSDSDDDDDLKTKKEVSFPQPVIRRSRRLNKILEIQSNKDDDSDNSDNESIHKIFNDSSSEEEVEHTKEVKPVKYEVILKEKSVIPDLSNDIILIEENNMENYVAASVIEASLKVNANTNSTVYQIVGEITKAIKTTKNIIIKPFKTVYDVIIQNKFKDITFEYILSIPYNYPFVQPTLKIITTCNQSLAYALNNCSILNATKWNPSTTLSDIIIGIYNNLEKVILDSINVEIKDKKFYELTSTLLSLTNTEPLKYSSYNFNFDFLQIKDSQSKGIGYDGPKWDYISHQKEQATKLIKITQLLNDVIPLISSNTDSIEDTCLVPYIKQYIYDVSVIEVNTKTTYYTSLFKLFHEIYKLEKYNQYFDLERISKQKNNLKDYPEIYECIPVIDQSNKVIDLTDYVSVMSEFAFEDANIIESKRFKFMEAIKIRHSASDFSRRVMTEITNISSNLPISKTSSIFFRYDPSNISIMKFIIIPHPDTPYAYGCFEFDMFLPSDFPSSPPHVEIITTGGGRFRFNPNLYDSGKVCLSLLGTWSGSDGEKWTTDSTILQILLSIQSLIFCEDPWFNEPGYEKDRYSAKGKQSNILYNDPVRSNTLALAMIGQLINPPFGFEEVIRNHFKLLQNDIYKKLDEWYEISNTKETFKQNYNKLKELISKL